MGDPRLREPPPSVCGVIGSSRQSGPEKRERESPAHQGAGIGSSWTNRERGGRSRRADGQEEEAAAGTPAGGDQATTLRPGSNQPGPARRGQQRAVVRHGAPLSPRGLGRAEPIPPRIFVLYLALAGSCLVLLMLPLEGQPSPLVPPALHVTLPQKLVAAYVLGLLTMAFLRS
ncbi:motile sperm domain-containing protein 3 [Podarcis muralis]